MDIGYMAQMAIRDGLRIGDEHARMNGEWTDDSGWLAREAMCLCFSRLGGRTMGWTMRVVTRAGIWEDQMFGLLTRRDRRPLSRAVFVRLRTLLDELAVEDDPYA
jgi:hypothetical protein